MKRALKRYVPNMRKVHAAARAAGIPTRDVTLSDRPGSKLKVIVPGGRAVYVGHPYYSDMTIHGDKKRQSNYLKRSKGMPHKKWSKNWLARKLLWAA